MTGPCLLGHVRCVETLVDTSPTWWSEWYRPRVILVLDIATPVFKKLRCR